MQRRYLVAVLVAAVLVANGSRAWAIETRVDGLEGPAPNNVVNYLAELEANGDSDRGGARVRGYYCHVFGYC